MIPLGLEKFTLNILIYAMKGHFSSCKGAHVLVQKSYQKKKKLNETAGKCSGSIRLSDLDNSPSATSLFSYHVLSHRRCMEMKAHVAWSRTATEVFLKTGESSYEQSHKR